MSYHAATKVGALVLLTLCSGWAVASQAKTAYENEIFKLENILIDMDICLDHLERTKEAPSFEGVCEVFQVEGLIAQRRNAIRSLLDKATELHKSEISKLSKSKTIELDGLRLYLAYLFEASANRLNRFLAFNEEYDLREKEKEKSTSP